MVGKPQYLLSIIFLSVSSFTILSADTVHVIAQGETLYSLARKYDVSLEDLLEKNSISDPSGLSVGTRLLIPGYQSPAPVTVSSGDSTATYTVLKGDTYYGIARLHNMQVDELLTLNSRNTNRILRVGETLVIRGSADTAVPDYTETRLTLAAPARVSNVPWWPVAGLKQPMDGKLVGVTIEATPQSYVHAVAGGNVVWTGPYRGFGHVVLVDSNGYIYLYGGNEDLFVNVGQTVTVGSRIGRLGSSGPNGGKQNMIFSVFREGVPVSPEDAPRG